MSRSPNGPLVPAPWSAAVWGLVLAGCVATAPTPEPTTAASAGPVAPPDPAASPPPPAAAPAPQVARLPPLPALDPPTLRTYSRERLVAALGSPVFQRQDKGAEILRFQGIDCVLDVYLYGDDRGPADPDGKPLPGPLRVAHLEARNSRGGAMAAADCLKVTPRERAG